MNRLRVGHAKRRIERLEKAVETMAWWLVSAQTGFGQRDAERICEILRGDADDLSRDQDPYACTCGPKTNGWNPSCPKHFARR